MAKPSVRGMHTSEEWLEKEQTDVKFSVSKGQSANGWQSLCRLSLSLSS